MEHAGEGCNWPAIFAVSAGVAFVIAFAVNWAFNRWRKY
jgi:hypothetical protein